MEFLISYLQTYEPKPKYAQAANGGNWEEAVRIDFTAGQAPDTSVLGEVDKSVAVEIFYDLSDGRAAFFGIRYSDTLSEALTPSDFLDKVTETFMAAPASPIRGMLSDLGVHLRGDEAAFINADVGYVELGVEDFWKSVGSKVLRKVGSPQLTSEELHNMLSDAPSLLVNNKNHTALEFAAHSPECWFGVRVSKKANGSYVTDLDALTLLANMI